MSRLLYEMYNWARIKAYNMKCGAELMWVLSILVERVLWRDVESCVLCASGVCYAVRFVFNSYTRVL